MKTKGIRLIFIENLNATISENQNGNSWYKEVWKNTKNWCFIFISRVGVSLSII